MARRRRAAVAPTPVAGTAQRERARERRNRRLVIAGVGGALALLLAVAALGYVNTFVQPPRRTALTVGDRSFSARDLQKRLSLALVDAAFSDVEMGTDPGSILIRMGDEEMLRQRASSLGVSVTDVEVTAAIAERLGVEPGGPGSAFDRAYRAELLRTHLGDREYREMVAAELLERRVREFFAAGLPERTDQVRLELILVATEEEAQTVIERVNGGEEFAEVAASASRDPDTAQLGGMKDWTPPGLLPPAVDAVAATIKRGQLSDPIKTDEGYYVIRVTGRRRDTNLDPAQREELVEAAYEAWLERQREELHVHEFLDAEMTAWVINEASKDAGSVGE